VNFYISGINVPSHRLCSYEIPTNVSLWPLPDGPKLRKWTVFLCVRYNFYDTVKDPPPPNRVTQFWLLKQTRCTRKQQSKVGDKVLQREFDVFMYSCANLELIAKVRFLVFVTRDCHETRSLYCSQLRVRWEVFFVWHVEFLILQALINTVITNIVRFCFVFGMSLVQICVARRPSILTENFLVFSQFF
jgi:hypothetical protein